MKEILDKITSYNIFNYLLPGTLFVYILGNYVGYNLVVENPIIGGFLYYFVGMVVSRFGSVLIEPILVYIKFLKFEDYKNYISASKKDIKIELLSEVNNTYRTISSMFILLIFIKLYKLLSESWRITDNISISFLVILMLALFIFSYRKQTNYITKRVRENNY